MSSKFRFLSFAALLVLGTQAGALEKPKELMDAANRIEERDRYSVHMEVKRHLPLTNNLSNEKYYLEAKKMNGGKWDLLLRGKEGTNKDRSLSCVTPCDTAVVKWPDRPGVRLHKGDPRLYLADASTPPGELRLVANLSNPHLEKTEPLPRENATRYTYRLLGGKDLSFYITQLWSFPYNENNEILRVQLTLDNKTNLPKRMTILKKRKESTDPAVTVYEKMWRFSFK